MSNFCFGHFVEQMVGIFSRFSSSRTGHRRAQSALVSCFFSLFEFVFCYELVALSMGILRNLSYGFDDRLFFLFLKNLNLFCSLDLLFLV